MKKLFTFAAAALTALTMNAQTTVFLWQYDGSSVYGDGASNGVFDVADNANGIVKFVTYEKKKTSADGTSAYAESVTDDDLKPSITKVCKLGNNGAHLRISPATGNFQAGDIIYICGYKDYIVSTSSDPTSTAKITTEAGGAVIIASSLATGEAKGSCAVGSVTLPESFVETNEIYISRANGNSAGVAAIKVVRPETKTIVSTEESLTAVTVNDVAISATDLASLVSNMYLFLEDAYVTAPVVKFTKHTVITYDDASTKEKDEVIEVTSHFQSATTTWGASATINGNSYYVYTSKAASRTVTYMYGEQVLGTETVAVNGNPAEYAQYETMPLATFGGWYKDADLTQAVANIAAEVISADATYYAKFTKAFLSESVNIEQLVLDNGINYSITDAFAAANIEAENIDKLDSLNDDPSKTNRNYAFLGLKLKKADAKLGCWLQAGHSIKIRFGNVGADFIVRANGVEQTMTNALANTSVESANELPFSATEDTYLEIICNSTKTLVVKQIMLDEDIQAVTLPDPLPTGINNTDAAVKAVKFFQNGQLMVEKNGVIYNAQGAIVK